MSRTDAPIAVISSSERYGCRFHTSAALKSLSLRQRGTTWTCRCATLWLTRSLSAMKAPSARRADSSARLTSRTRENNGPIWASGRSSKVATWATGATSVWPRCSGRWSRKATTTSSRKTISAFSDPRTIAQNTHSVIFEPSFDIGLPRRFTSSRMATITHPLPRAAPGPVIVEERRSALVEWLTTTDHKKIGILYLVTTFIFFFIGGLEALLVRSQLAGPDQKLLTAAQYNEMFTMHATTMIFLFVIPVFTGFANYVLPLMIGAKDMAFPRLNMLSYWLLLAGGLMLYASFPFGQGDLPAGGWTSYVPLTTARFSPGLGQTFWILAIQLIGLSSILGALNFIVTIFTLRAPGMTFSRIPLFVWAQLVTAFLTVLAVPFITVAITFLLFDRVFGTEFFSTAAGSDPKLYQFLFWYYSHPVVYIMILPGFGIISEVLPVFSRKPIFGYKLIAYSSVAIG